MNNVIGFVNRIQRACTAVGDYEGESAVGSLWEALPSVAVVGGQVYFILRDLVRKTTGECTEWKRFPSLQGELAQAAIEALEKDPEDARWYSTQEDYSEIWWKRKPATSLAVDSFFKLPQEIE